MEDMDLTGDVRGSVVMTDTDATILYASKGVSERTGFDVPEAVGRRPSDVWGGGMDRPFYARLWRLISKGVPFVGRVRNHRKSGEVFETPLYIAPLRDETDIRGYLALQPETDDAAFEARFVRAAASDASPLQLQSLLHERFGWNSPKPVQTRDHLLNALTDTLVEPLRKRYRAREADTELVRASQNKAEAFGCLVAKYQGVLRRYYRHRLSDGERAEELVQETFERAFRALPGFRTTNASYQTYLLRIAHNLLVSEYRRTGPEEVVTDIPGLGWLDRLESRDAVERALAVLGAEDRQVVEWFHLDGYPVRAIATKIGTTENAVKLRLSRARKKMRETL